jgi:hypothetical protein
MEVSTYTTVIYGYYCYCSTLYCFEGRMGDGKRGMEDDGDGAEGILRGEGAEGMEE